MSALLSTDRQSQLRLMKFHRSQALFFRENFIEPPKLGHRKAMFLIPFGDIVVRDGILEGERRALRTRL
jgi:hypothetical protein